MWRIGICVRTGLILALALAGGCAYPVSQTLREQAREGLTVARVIETPNAYRQAVVIWGGVVRKVEHREGGSTLLVEEYPLDRRGRPKAWEETGGRFLATTPRDPDPTVFEKGRWITVGGEITGVQTEKSERDKVEYRYPIVALRETYLWPRYIDYYYDPYYVQPYDPGPWWGQPGPYRRPYWPYYYQPYDGSWLFW